MKNWKKALSVTAAVAMAATVAMQRQQYLQMETRLLRSA